MRYSVLFICCLLGIGTLSAQEQYIFGTLNENLDSCLMAKPVTRIHDGEVLPDSVSFYHSGEESFSSSLQILEGNLPSSHLELSVHIAGSIYRMELQNGQILSELGDTIGAQTVEFGDVLSFGLQDQTLFYLHNQQVLVEKQIARDQQKIHTGLKVLDSGQTTIYLGQDTFLAPKPIEVNFTQNFMEVPEGEEAQLCINLTNSNPYSWDIPINISLISTDSLHFLGFTSEQIIIPSGRKGPFCLTVPTQPANGLPDANIWYDFKLDVIAGRQIKRGPDSLLTVKIADDIAPDAGPKLVTGDIIFIGFDNDIGQDRDRIVISNLVTLTRGTQFSIANALYCASENEWYSRSAHDEYVASQQFTYIGQEPLPAGSVICFNLPAYGDTPSRLLARDFEINGQPDNQAFQVNVDGISASPDINLRKDENNSLFLLQGQWERQVGHAIFNGRVMSAILIGDTWGNDPCGSVSDLPFTNDCSPTPAIDTTGSLYGRFNCSDYAAQMSKEDFLIYAQDGLNWDVQGGTASLDLGADACSLDCQFTLDSLYWAIFPDTLTITCYENYEDQIDIWLAANGNGVASSSCSDSILIYPVYTPASLPDACSSTGISVPFFARDSCGNQIQANGHIFLQEANAPVLTSPARDTSISCGSDAEILAALDYWLGINGGAQIQANCGIKKWEYVTTVEPADCGFFNYTDADFHALTFCGDTLSTSARFSVVDNTPPTFVQQPQSLTLSCDDPDFVGKLQDWLRKGGNAQVEDNCSKIINTWENNLMSYPASCSTTSVTFTAFDGCGNSATANADLVITDTAPPQFKNPETTLLLYCTTPVAEQDTIIQSWLSDNGNLDYWDECKSAVSISNDYVDDGNSRICGSQSFTFTASDACGNSSYATGIIQWVDTSLIHLIQHPADLVLYCQDTTKTTQWNNWLDGGHGGQVSDLCYRPQSLIWNVYYDTTSTLDACGSFPVTFVVSDSCGHDLYLRSEVIVLDTIAPTIITEAQDFTWDPSDSISNVNFQQWLVNGNAAAIDDCQSTLIWTSDYYHQPDGLICGETTVNFVVSDGCNSDTTTAVLTKNYNCTLSWTTPPSSLDLTCSDSLDAIILNWLDNLGGGVVTSSCSNDSIVVTTRYLGEIVEDYCSLDGGMIEFTATNECGQQAVDTASLIVHSVSPTFLTYAQDTIVYCNSDFDMKVFDDWVDRHANATVNESSGCFTWINSSSDWNPLCGSGSMAGSREVTFQVIGFCGDTISTSAIFSIVDDSPPYGVSGAEDLELSCSDPYFENKLRAWERSFISAADDCGSVISSVSYDPGRPDKDQCGDYTATFTVEDACGNEYPDIIRSQVIVDSEELIVTNNDDDDLILTCGASDNLSRVNEWLDDQSEIEISGGCGSISYEYSPNFSYTIEYMLSSCQPFDFAFSYVDGCGQVAEITRRVNYGVDCESINVEIRIESNTRLLASLRNCPSGRPKHYSWTFISDDDEIPDTVYYNSSVTGYFSTQGAGRYTVVATCGEGANSCSAFDEYTIPCENITPEIEADCSAPSSSYDLLFLLDNSKYINPAEYTHMRRQIIRQLQELYENSIDVRYAVFGYSPLRTIVDWKNLQTDGVIKEYDIGLNPAVCAQLDQSLPELYHQAPWGEIPRQDAEFHIILLTGSPVGNEQSCSNLSHTYAVDLFETKYNATISVMRYADWSADGLAADTTAGALVSTNGGYIVVEELASSSGDINYASIPSPILDCTHLSVDPSTVCSDGHYEWSAIASTDAEILSTTPDGFGITTIGKGAYQFTAICNGCIYTDTYDYATAASVIVSDTTSGIEDNFFEQVREIVRRPLPRHQEFLLEEIRIFPNPTSDLVNIEFNSATDQEVQIIFFDLSGRAVLRRRNLMPEGFNYMEIATNHLPPGMYLIKLQTREKMFHERLVIAR